MSDLMKAWLLPRPVFAPDGDGAAAAEETTETGAAEETTNDAGATDGASTETTTQTDDTGASEGAALPENWRELAAEGDDDLLKELKRYGSLKNVVKALKESKDTIRSGKLKRDMPDPKDEKAMAEWRRAEGIPDEPTGYVFSDDVKKRMTDEDKPLLSSFTEFAHTRGATPAAVNLAADWYFNTLETMEGERIAKDGEARESAEETLRKDWGPEYKANLTLATQFVEGIPGVGKDWTEARMPDGRRLGDIPEFVGWASDMGRGEFGDPTFATSDSVERHNNRKAEIEQVLKTDRDRYFREGLDKEYGEILQKEEKRRK